VTTARIPLPHRRPSATIDAEFRGFPMAITIGYDPTTGVSREVFANAGRSGSDMQATLADACVLVSIALQHGVTPAALAKSLGRVPDPMRGEDATDHASPIGVIVAALGATDAA
jgi:hypothetical protein